MSDVETFYFTESERQTRNQWLIAAILAFGYPIVTSVLSFVWHYKASQWPENLFFVLNILTALSFFFYVWYHFAYRNHGTLVLAISLICAFSSLDRVPHILAEPVASFAFWKLLVGLFIDLWWYLLCFKLRAINLKLPRTVLPSSDPYILAIRQAANLKQLHWEYLNATRKDPLCKGRYSEEYEMRRRVLSEAGLH